ncbi:4'-phosphopantetheinyl transferase superfamily protein [Rhodovulum sulfidophilum]|uniref:4'-phosphopantetheinyl transferase family protein n=1 Tax=Rhodovulum sulfidophilum TaxID=35806 RepID=UPI001926B53A|nr:4'-phosphopantetheinyl transferase superfamily protein [Rhodovulum sulfidophilum]MBL3585607.1 4'-phosphopantetheinyl transferase superfamily protein [Rhodovulum sulfidophilum]
MAECLPGPAGVEAALARLGAALPDCRAAVVPVARTEGPKARRAAEFRAGRLAAAAASASLTGMPCLAGRGADGAPLWPVGLAGSISHSGGQALALVGPSARRAGLGVDIEGPLSPRVAAEIAPVALTPEERACFGTDPVWVGLIFSAKESLFKALSPRIGRRFDFDAARLLPGGATRPPLLCLTCDLAPGWEAGRRIEPVLIAHEQGVMTAVALQPRKVAPPST